ncbi:uncharacterized protein LOC118196767 [Stegodyphus dumicola]|uniref:uncharacterized protein LOC118196767 n=1 Tax=Stegodyphus dumicola TaxID=202533 RepID=UPI0015A78C0D|nr:uncharacterized protein LOC118196767 [Stegodyphus dumicola]
MWKLSLLLFLGLLAVNKACEENIIRGCLDELAADMESLRGLPNEDELRRICPGMLETFECIRKRALACRRGTPEEAARRQDDLEDARSAQLFLNIESLVKDLCDEDTSLHKSYIRTHHCTSEYFSEPKMQCRREAEAAYAAYRDLTENLPEGNDIEETGKGECLVQAYAFACIAHDLQTACGEEARAVLGEIIQRSKISKLTTCSDVNIEELKANFLESLNLEEERRDIFSSAFFMIKKKK